MGWSHRARGSGWRTESRQCSARRRRTRSRRRQTQRNVLRRVARRCGAARPQWGGRQPCGIDRFAPLGPRAVPPVPRGGGVLGRPVQQVTLTCAAVPPADRRVTAPRQCPSVSRESIYNPVSPARPAAPGARLPRRPPTSDRAASAVRSAPFRAALHCTALHCTALHCGRSGMRRALAGAAAPRRTPATDARSALPARTASARGAMRAAASGRRS
jgi:hypothetical protein